MRNVLPLLLFRLPTLFGLTPCTICKGGESITIPDGVLGFTSPVAIPDCATMVTFLPYIDADSSDCLGIQAMGSLCGCPFPENSCQLCGSESLANPDLEVDTLVDKDLLFDSANGRLFDCSFVHAVLAMELTEGDTKCSYGKQQLVSACCSSSSDNVFVTTEVIEPCELCPGGALDDSSFDVNIKGVNMTCGEAHGMGLNRTMCRELQEECICQATCPLCADGSVAPDPNKTLDTKSLGMPKEWSTCGALEKAIRLFETASDECKASRVYSRLCGCSFGETACNLCGTQADSVPYPDRAFTWSRGNSKTVLPDYLQSFSDRSPTFGCDVFQSLQSQVFDQDNRFCWTTSFQSGACGCPNDDVQVLVWVQVVAGIVSVISSLFLIVSAISTPERRCSTYFQALAGLSLFTFLGSMGYSFGSFLMPSSGGYYMSIGNEVTCMLQAYLIELGLIAGLYNIVLALYFYSIYGCKTTMGPSFLRWIHVAIWVIGISLASAGLPYYDVGLTRCQIPPPPVAFSLWPGIIFVILPITIVTLVLMTFICLTSYYHCKDTKKSLERRQVFGLSLGLALNCIFCMTPQISQFGDSISEKAYPLIIVTNLLWPSHGTLNLLVYLWSSWSMQNDTDKDLDMMTPGSPIDQKPEESLVSFQGTHRTSFQNGPEKSASGGPSEVFLDNLDESPLETIVEESHPLAGASRKKSTLPGDRLRSSSHSIDSHGA